MKTRVIETLSGSNKYFTSVHITPVGVVLTVIKIYSYSYPRNESRRRINVYTTQQRTDVISRVAHKCSRILSHYRNNSADDMRIPGS
jgi:hypothetical protein